jgi:hypothetical protein
MYRTCFRLCVNYIVDANVLKLYQLIPTLTVNRFQWTSYGPGPDSYRLLSATKEHSVVLESNLSGITPPFSSLSEIGRND